MSSTRALRSTMLGPTPFPLILRSSKRSWSPSSLLLVMFFERLGPSGLVKSSSSAIICLRSSPWLHGGLPAAPHLTQSVPSMTSLRNATLFASYGSLLILEYSAMNVLTPLPNREPPLPHRNRRISPCVLLPPPVLRSRAAPTLNGTRPGLHIRVAV